MSPSKAQHSGPHAGTLRGYSQGDGASFVPSAPFQAGERVSVRAVIGAGAGRQVAFQFGVDTPYPTADAPLFPNPQAAPADYQSFYTAPGVQAPVLTVTSPDSRSRGRRHPHHQRARPRASTGR